MGFSFGVAGFSFGVAGFSFAERESRDAAETPHDADRESRDADRESRNADRESRDAERESRDAAVHPTTPIENPATPIENPATPNENPTTPVEKPATPNKKPATPTSSGARRGCASRLGVKVRSSTDAEKEALLINSSPTTTTWGAPLHGQEGAQGRPRPSRAPGWISPASAAAAAHTEFRIAGGLEVVDTAASLEVDAWIAAAPWRHAAGPAPEREPSRCASGPDAGPPFPSAYGCLMAAPGVASRDPEEEIQYRCHECARQRPRSLFSPCLVHRHVMTPPPKIYCGYMFGSLRHPSIYHNTYTYIHILSAYI